MAVAKNDSKILGLRAAIQRKKNAIAAVKRFTPITNCLLELEGGKVNINVLNEEQLVSSLVLINAYRTSAVELGLEDVFKPSGFTTMDWIDDIKARLAIIGIKAEKRKLALLETKLTALLSSDKKVELELEELENEIDSL